MHRRDLFKVIGAAGASVLVSTDLQAQDRGARTGDSASMGILVDTTMCLGCREC